MRLEFWSADAAYGENYQYLCAQRLPIDAERALIMSRARLMSPQHPYLCRG